MARKPEYITMLENLKYFMQELDFCIKSYIEETKSYAKMKHKIEIAKRLIAGRKVYPLTEKQKQYLLKLSGIYYEALKDVDSPMAPLLEIDYIKKITKEGGKDKEIAEYLVSIGTNVNQEVD